MTAGKTFMGLALLSAFLSAPASPTRAGVENSEVADKIIARVGAYPIMISELAAQVQMVAMQTGFQPRTEAEVREFQEEILEQLVNDKLFLIAAQQDTTMRVKEEEVEAALDEQVKQITARFPSEQAFLDALAADGMTLREMRRKFYPDIESRILKDKFIGRKLSQISVSRQEVAEFYEKYRDSIPDQPAAVRVAHVLLPYKPSDATLDSALSRAKTIRRSAVSGADFSGLAAQYSAPPGGDLGWIRREDVTDDFGSAVFALQPGQVSGVVKTDVGFHIIRVTDRRGDSARVSQIFFPVVPTASDTALTFQLADSLKTEVINGLSFAEAAKEFSVDDQTRRTEGELGWFSYEELPVEFATVINQDTQIGAIVGPVGSEFGVHIIKILEKQEAQIITLEDNYDQLRELARRRKADRLINEWIDERKQDTFVEIHSIR